MTQHTLDILSLKSKWHFQGKHSWTWGNEWTDYGQELQVAIELPQLMTEVRKDKVGHTLLVKEDQRGPCLCTFKPPENVMFTKEWKVVYVSDMNLCWLHKWLWRDFWGWARGCDGREEVEPKLYTDCGWNLSQTWFTVSLLLPRPSQQLHWSRGRWGSEERSHSQPSLVGWDSCPAPGL